MKRIGYLHKSLKSEIHKKGGAYQELRISYQAPSLIDNDFVYPIDTEKGYNKGIKNPEYRIVFIYRVNN